jgi:hypothetical protein
MQPQSRYADIKNKESIKNNFLKPLHEYALNICPMPEQNKNILTQRVYAESLIHFTKRERIKMVSRTAIQQYKKMSYVPYEIPDNCFKSLFAFYVAWFPDIDKEVTIKNCSSEESPFYLPQDIKINFKNIYPEPRIELEEVWVPFFVKKESKSIKSEYGKILLNDVAYEIEI